METIWRDLRYGLRQLWQSPGFTIVAVLTLALGIGANTAIFQLIDSIRLRTIPVKNPEELGTRDPVTLAMAIVTLTAVAGLASFVLAYRASRVDPMVALREE